MHASVLLTPDFIFLDCERRGPSPSVSLRLSCQTSAVNKLLWSMPAPLFIDSATLIEHGSNQSFCSDEAPELNYS